MIKMKTISVVLMASSIIDKKSPRPGCRAEHRATDLRGRTRRKNPSQGLGRLHLSSCYFSQAFEDRHFRKFEVLLGRMQRSRGDPDRRVVCKISVIKYLVHCIPCHDRPTELARNF